MNLTHTILNPEVEYLVRKATLNDKLKVETPENLCEFGARLCYDSMNKFGSNLLFLGNTLNAKHLDVMEHVYLAAEVKLAWPQERYYAYYTLKERYPYLQMKMQQTKMVIGATGRVWNEIDQDAFAYLEGFVEQKDFEYLRAYLHYIMPTLVKQPEFTTLPEDEVLRQIRRQFNELTNKATFPEVVKDVYKHKTTLMAYTPPLLGNFFYASFLFDDVSRSFTHQLVRHRRMAHLQKSDRYCEPKDTRHLVVNPTLAQVHKEVMANHFSKSIELYDYLRQSGLKKEDARGILDTNISTNIMTSGDLAGWQHVISERTGTGAQDEIKTAAFIVKDILCQITNI